MLFIFLILTIICESLVLLFLRERRIGVFIFFAALNTVTNLSLNLLIHRVSFISARQYHFVVLVLEVLVFALEATLYFFYEGNMKKCIKYSFFCNLISYFGGFFVLSIFNF